MVNLKAKPYNLDEQGIKWVEETIANMTRTTFRKHGS